jgi:hypothetical protein
MELGSLHVLLASKFTPARAPISALRPWRAQVALPDSAGKKKASSQAEAKRAETVDTTSNALCLRAARPGDINASRAD